MDAFAKLGIDGWSILLYLVNFGILLFVMRRFVYRPLLSFIDGRREMIAQSVAEAESLRKEFAQATEDHSRQNDAQMLELRTKTEEIKQHAQAEANKVIEAARSEREALMTATREELERLKANIVKDVEAELQEKIKKVLLLILRDSVPAEAVQKSVENAWQDIKKLAYDKQSFFCLVRRHTSNRRQKWETHPIWLVGRSFRRISGRSGFFLG